MTAHPTVLIVDDDPDACEMLRLVLLTAGYGVVTASSGRAGIDHLRSSHDIWCVLLDLNPHGIDAALFRAVQLRDRALAWIPVVILSERLDVDDAARQLGVRAYLRKPFDLDQLRRVVADAVATVMTRARR